MARGRPRTIVEINFNHPLDSLDEIRVLCQSESIRANIVVFATGLLGLADIKVDPDFLMEHIFKHNTKETFVDSVCRASDNMAIYEKSHLIANLFLKIPQVEGCKLLYLMYSNMGYEGQCDVFSFLDSSLNENLKTESVEKVRNASKLSIKDLKKATKDQLYDECDGRLKNFIDAITHKQWNSPKDDNNTYKANVYENLLKARNGKYVSDIGLKEHMVIYLASGKSVHASQNPLNCSCG